MNDDQLVYGAPFIWTPAQIQAAGWNTNIDGPLKFSVEGEPYQLVGYGTVGGANIGIGKSLDGNYEAVYQPLPEVTVTASPGKSLKTANGDYANTSDDYYKWRVGTQFANNVNKASLGMMAFGSAPVVISAAPLSSALNVLRPFAPDILAGTEIGTGADLAMKLGSDRTYGEWGQYYLSPYLKKYMSPETANIVGDLAGESFNPGGWFGNYKNLANVGKDIANTTAKGAVNISKSVTNATKDLSKSAYNLYGNGTLWDRYTTFRGRFGNYSDNPFVNVYATTARRFGLPDKARIPADAMRKMGQTSGDLVNIKDGVVDFTGGKSWGNKPHVNFTLDRGVGSHPKGNWDGRDMYIMPTEDFINQTLPSGSLKSIEPTDMFASGVHVTEDPSKVTVISGDIETLKKAQEAGMQTLSSPKLRKMYQNELNSYNRSTTGILAKIVKPPKRTLGIDYAREVQRLQGQRGTPTLSDFRLLEKMTGLKSGVTSVSEYDKAIDAINHMLHDQVGVAKQYVYPNGRTVGWGINGINWQLKNLKQLPYNNVFYDPASPVEFNWRHAMGLE